MQYCVGKGKDLLVTLTLWCYLTLVQPMLEYACVAWSPFTLNNFSEIRESARAFK